MILNKRGLTLLELVLSIIIISVCFIPLAAVYQQVLSKLYKSKVITVANALTEEKIDEVLGDGYSGISSETSTAFASPFNDYSYEVDVDYVNTGGLNTTVAGPTEYKRVEVRVTHGEIGTAALVSLLSDHTD